MLLDLRFLARQLGLSSSDRVSKIPVGGRIRCPTLLCYGIALFFGSSAATDLAAGELAATEQFEKRIRPLFADRCSKCHTGEQAKGGFRLEGNEAIQRGGNSGPVIVAGSPEESLLIRAVRYEGDLKMPPDRRLTEAQIADLTAWVKTGAVWPVTSTTSLPQHSNADHRGGISQETRKLWAFQPVREVRPPQVRDLRAVASPVDRFIVQRLESMGLSLAAPAEKSILLRRATLDLTGLPPTLEEIESFLQDDSPQAFEKVVTRLLSSSHYGEHWGRHWLDVVRYGDTTANDGNAIMRFAWRYRNYVIDSFNRDAPYDEFLVEQIAGDLMPSNPGDNAQTRVRRLIATGFLMVGPKALAETDKEQTRLDIVDDQIDVVGRAILGLTISCARCHDHKFDPIPTSDYYALAGIFRSTEPFEQDSQSRTRWWEFPAPDDPSLIVMAPKEGKPRDLQIHIRGNRFTLGAQVPRGFLKVLTTSPQPLPKTQSGRLELARWISNREHPLTARVIVNRIWQHHFGRGLVATSDNFGARGDSPSHPELLDFLAKKFVDDGWSVKKLHKLIMLSNVYRQSCKPTTAALERDPENISFSHFTRRRLAAEELRDSILAVSGQLDLSPGTFEGTTAIFREAEIQDRQRGIGFSRMPSDHPFYTSFRKRSVYLPVVRNMLSELISVFDGADPNISTASRNDTTVPAQALLLMNSTLMQEQSRHFAERICANRALTHKQRCDLASQLACTRSASAVESQKAEEFLRNYIKIASVRIKSEAELELAAWQSYCQMLLCSNEFLYVE